MTLITRVGVVVLSTVLLVIMSACSTTQRTTHSPRTAIEQLLHSEAISRSLKQKTQQELPIPGGAKVAISTAGLSGDTPFVGDVVGGWLGNQGYLIESPENAQYRVHIVVNALGTEFDETFFGIPPVNSAFIPISLPQLSFYKSQNQVGYSNFYLNVFEHPSGRLVHTSPLYMAETFYNDYTVLFLLKFNKTDLPHPPKSKSLSRLVE